MICYCAKLYWEVFEFVKLILLPFRVCNNDCLRCHYIIIFSLWLPLIVELPLTVGCWSVVLVALGVLVFFVWGAVFIFEWCCFSGFDYFSRPVDCHVLVYSLVSTSKSNITASFWVWCLCAYLLLPLSSSMIFYLMFFFDCLCLWWLWFCECEGCLGWQWFWRWGFVGVGCWQLFCVNCFL